MLSKNLNERYKSKLIEIIHKHIPQCKIYLFGSFARGSQGQGSDIDLGLDNKKIIPLRLIGNIKEAIEDSTIPYNVDVVDVHSVSETMKHEILDKGILWTH